VRSDLFMVKAKSMFAVGVAMVSIFAYLNSVYDGRVVARLPFEPVFPIRSLSHRNLLGSDYTECAFIFICIVTLTHTPSTASQLAPESVGAVCFSRRARSLTCTPHRRRRVADDPAADAEAARNGAAESAGRRVGLWIPAVRRQRWRQQQIKKAND
jgi:hypothetical protein